MPSTIYLFPVGINSITYTTPKVTCPLLHVTLPVFVCKIIISLPIPTLLLYYLPRSKQSKQP